MLKRRFSKKTDSDTTENIVPEENNLKNEDITEDTNEDMDSVDVDNKSEEVTDTDQETSEANDIPEVEGNAGELNEEVESLKKELSESQDKYLRLAAEFDNYRKRTLREKAELIHTAGESLLKEILPVVDDFDRGLEISSKAEDMESVKTGMELIYSKLKEFLANHGIKDIQAMDELFDSDLHEAVAQIPVSSEDKKGKIVDVIQKGYMLNDKVIRYPKVVVGD